MCGSGGYVSWAEIEAQRARAEQRREERRQEALRAEAEAALRRQPQRKVVHETAEPVQQREPAYA